MEMPAFLLESKSSDSSNHDGCGGEYVEVSLPSNLSPATGAPNMTSNRPIATSQSNTAVEPQGESKLMKCTQGAEEVNFFSIQDNFWKASIGGGIHGSATTAPKFGDMSSKTNMALFPSHDVCQPAATGFFTPPPKDSCTTTVSPIFSSFPPPTPTFQPSNHPGFSFKPTVKRATEASPAYTTSSGNHSHSLNPHQCWTCRGKTSQDKCGLCNNHVPAPTAKPTFVQSWQAESSGEHRCICCKPTGDATQTIEYLSRMGLNGMFPFIPVVMMPMIPNFNNAFNAVPWSTGIGPVAGSTIPPFGVPYRPEVNNMAWANYGSIMAPHGLLPMMLPQFTNFNGPATAANGNTVSGFVNFSGSNSPLGNNVSSTSASEPEKAPASNPTDNARKETSNPNSYSCKWCMTRGRDLRCNPVYEEITSETSQPSVIMSISAMPAASHLSPEELRWEYQEAHRGIANSLPQCLRQSNSAATCSSCFGNKPNNVPSFSFSKANDGASPFPSTFSNKPLLGSVFGTCLSGSNLNTETSPFSTSPSDSAASCIPAFGDNPNKVPSSSFGKPNDTAAICSSSLVNKPNNVTFNIFGKPASPFRDVSSPFGGGPAGRVILLHHAPLLLSELALHRSTLHSESHRIVAMLSLPKGQTTSRRLRVFVGAVDATSPGNKHDDRLRMPEGRTVQFFVRIFISP